MSKELDITRMLTINTAHIKEETAEKIDEFDLVTFDKVNFGWFIYIPTEKEDVMEILEDKNIPDDLVDCIRLAWENNCNWLCLDRDASEFDELETYEW